MSVTAGQGAEDRFAEVVAELRGQPGVTAPDGSSRRFGSDALQVNGSIFAMLTRGQLVVKLPQDRVSALIHDATGAPFSASRGTPMKEWVAVVDEEPATWLALAREALAFVSRPKG